MRVIAGLLVAIGGCTATASPGPTAVGTLGASPSIPPVIFGTAEPTRAGGAEALVADLAAAGATATLGSNFLAEPLPGEGILACVGQEPVQIYVLKDHEAALEAASRIDPDDPSKVGTSIVEWAGTPRFWLRDRIIVLYVGDDADTEAVLRSVLGEPFAQGQPGRPPLPAPDCA
jgi:hypothetical protein